MTFLMLDDLKNKAGSDDYIVDFNRRLRPGQLLEGLFEAVPGVYYFVKDLQGRFVGASLGFAKIMGAKSVEEVLGKTDHDLQPDFLADAFCEDDQQVFNSNKALYEKIELVPMKDGSIDWLSTSKIPLVDREGKVVGLAGIARIIYDSESVYANHPEMRQIIDYLKTHFGKKLSMANVASSANISISKLERLFKKMFGITPLMYLHKVRLHAACSLLRYKDTDLADIAIKCGFNDQTNMTRAFRLELKITPLKYRVKFRNVDTSTRKSRSIAPIFTKY